MNGRCVHLGVTCDHVTTDGKCELEYCVFGIDVWLETTKVEDENGSATGQESSKCTQRPFIVPSP